MFRFLIKLICYIPFRLIFWMKWVDKKKLTAYKKSPYVLACNHRNGMDGPAMVIMNRPFVVWIKEEFFKTAFWRWVWRHTGGIPVKAGADLSLIRNSQDALLKQKKPLVIFPQGHRSFNTEEELQIRSGVAMIALRTGVPIIPVVSDRAVKAFRLSRFKAGDAINSADFLVEGKVTKDGIERLSDAIKTRMEEMLVGFEKKEKLKKWQKVQSVISRGIVINNDRLLVIKRVKDGQEYFVLPGGHIEDGETGKAAAEREVAEETGVTVGAFRELYKYYFHDKTGRGTGYQSFYVCEYKNGEPHQTDAEEYTESGRAMGSYQPMWLPVSEIPAAAIRPLCVKKRLLRDYKKKGARLPFPLRLVRGKK